MKPGQKIMILLALAVLLLPDRALARDQVEVWTTPERAPAGSEIKINCRLGTQEGSWLFAARGGRLTVSIFELKRGDKVATFTAVPDGTTQLFGVVWRPETAGPHLVEVAYLNPSTGERTEARAAVEVVPAPPETASRIAAAPPPSTAPLPPAAATPAPSKSDLPGPSSPDPTRPETTPPPAAALPGPPRTRETMVTLEALPGRDKGVWRVRIRVADRDGEPVPGGEVLVWVDRETLSLGGGKEAFLPLDQEGRAEVEWRAGEAEPGAPAPTLEASFFGGPAAQGDYRPSSARLEGPGAQAREKAELPALTDGLGLSFHRLPAGSFLMGAAKRPGGPIQALEPGQVTIERPFWMGVHEVTQELWTRVMGTNPSRRNGPRWPVENVTWDQIQEFLRRLNARETGAVYRLPTEAEWEYACRAGTSAAWSFGDDPRLLAEHAWWIGNSDLRTRPVGRKKPNPWGLYDLHGNVSELCSDPLDGSRGEAPGGVKGRVWRGGSWQDGPRETMSASRRTGRPGGSLGLRLVREE